MARTWTRTTAESQVVRLPSFLRWGTHLHVEHQRFTAGTGPIPPFAGGCVTAAPESRDSCESKSGAKVRFVELFFRGRSLLLVSVFVGSAVLTLVSKGFRPFF